MSFSYSNLSLTEIVADLEETLSDLYINAGEHHLEPLLDLLDTCKFFKDQKPSERLVALMEELLTHDRNLLDSRAQTLMSEAVQEIKQLHDGTASQDA